MSLRLFFAYALIAALLLPGCLGTGEVIDLNLQPLPGSPKGSKGSPDESLVIAVDPFRDGRENTKRIGFRTHFWGGFTNFTAWNGDIGEGMAKLAVAYLKQNGWNASRSSGGDPSSKTRPDVTLTGKVLTWDSNAKSGFGFTKLDVVMKVLFELTNAKDKSTVRMVLGSNGTDTVVLFNHNDLEILTNEVARQLFEQLFRDLMIQDKTFRLRS